MLSENTGSHHELMDFVISVNPFDIQEQSDAIYRALTMDPAQKAGWAQGLREIIFSRNPGDWVDDQLADIEEARAART
jgi:trehalose 6-phosphate synthase